MKKNMNITMNAARNILSKVNIVDFLTWLQVNEKFCYIIEDILNELLDMSEEEDGTFFVQESSVFENLPKGKVFQGFSYNWEVASYLEDGASWLIENAKMTTKDGWKTVQEEANYIMALAFLGWKIFPENNEASIQTALSKVQVAHGEVMYS